MNRKHIPLLGVIVLFAMIGVYIFTKQHKSSSEFVSYTADCKSQSVKLYWKDDKGEIYGNIGNLKEWLDKKQCRLEFAMNGGMYRKDNSPKGLFIEEQATITTLDTANGTGNFYLKPNGVFYITTDNIPVVCNTAKFLVNNKIKFATQSGPMLLIEGNIHPLFKEGSTNLNIRNGVGILPDNKILFAMSKKEITFYELAKYFKSMGCKNALYLDGFVSRAYLPKEGWMQTDGDLGVIIGVTSKSR